MPHATHYLILTLALMTFAAGCESIKDVSSDMGITEGEQATVTVPFPQLGEPVTVVVTASSNDFSKQAIRLMRINEFSKAEAALESAVAADPKDHKSYFALGIARELLGDDRAARDAYVTAFSLNAKQREYEQALNRVKMKLGEE